VPRHHAGVAVHRAVATRDAADEGFGHAERIDRTALAEALAILRAGADEVVAAVRRTLVRAEAHQGVERRTAAARRSGREGAGLGREVERRVQGADVQRLARRAVEARVPEARARRV